jgi:hypothetical protein
MKEFMLLLRGRIDHHDDWPESHTQEFLHACEIYINGLSSSGMLISAQPLIREGLILSGSEGAWKTVPFDEGPEVVVGYYHIRASDLDEAVEIARGNPEFDFGATLRIEVRPIKTMEESTEYVYPKMR